MIIFLLFSRKTEINFKKLLTNADDYDKIDNRWRKQQRIYWMLRKKLKNKSKKLLTNSKICDKMNELLLKKQNSESSLKIED